MTIRNLEALFAPRSVAVIGASRRPRSVGLTLLNNLLAAGFPGAILPVNPRHESVSGVLAYPSVEALPMVPDLAVIATPPSTVPGLIAELGRRGTRAAIVLTAGLEAREASGRSLGEAMLQAARPHLLRILGPNCLGLIVPGQGLNASFARGGVQEGPLAFVSQSGALCAAVQDWAIERGIGFSHFVSLGNCADVDAGDVLDYLGGDPATRAVLLYLESISAGRKFITAARAASRNKPVIVVKAGRHGAGRRAAFSHTGALLSDDRVVEAVLQRAGALRVGTFEELFAAVETLARGGALRGERLAIVTNGGGAGVMAVDALDGADELLAELSSATRTALDAVLPATWSGTNPVDIVGDAPLDRYRQALQVLLVAPEVDAVLVIHCPTALVPADEIAEAVCTVASAARRSLLTCWLGGAAVRAARARCHAAGIACYATPEEAVRAFQQMVEHRRNQTLLRETPPSTAAVPAERRATVRTILARALAAGRTVLDPLEVSQVLAAYDIPCVPTELALDPEAAGRAAERLGLPAVLKVHAPELPHKSEAGAVRLDLASGTAVREAAVAMRDRLGERRPPVTPAGFIVQPMVRRPDAWELIIGAAVDAVFGPVLLFGQGGTQVEVVADRAVALPPLNPVLARELIGRTRIARQLAGYRDRRPAHHDAIVHALVRISELVSAHAEIVELDLNPLLADAAGVLALDARVRIGPSACEPQQRLAIRPYPQELEEACEIDGQRVLLRPIRPEDEPQHAELLRALTPEDMRFRFFGSVRLLSHTELARYTQIDYEREMAFVAEVEAGDAAQTLGVVRAVADPDHWRAEFAIVVRSRWQGRGLGRILLDKLVRYCQGRGIRVLVGEVLSDNRAMRELARQLGFRETAQGETVQVQLDLGP